MDKVFAQIECTQTPIPRNVAPPAGRENFGERIGRRRLGFRHATAREHAQAEERFRGRSVEGDKSAFARLATDDGAPS